MASEGLATNLTKCSPLESDHGSDHGATNAMFETSVPEQQHQERLLLKNAPWKGINTRIANEIERLSVEGTAQGNTDRLKSAVAEAVHAPTPKAKPSPHAKRS